MFPLTVSPSLATRSTGSSVNLWMAAVTPMKNVRLAENLGFSPTAIVTGSAACQAPCSTGRRGGGIAPRGLNDDLPFLLVV